MFVIESSGKKNDCKRIEDPNWFTKDATAIMARNTLYNLKHGKPVLMTKFTNPTDKNWMKMTELESMHNDGYKLIHFAVCVVAECMIVVTGGTRMQGQTGKTDEVHIFDLNNEKWFTAGIPALNRARMMHAACAIQGTVYVAGGDRNDNTCEFLHLTT